MKLNDSINSQFKLLSLKNKYYFVDIDSNVLAYFIPMLLWLLPLKATKIDKNTFDVLKNKRSRKNNYIVLSIIGFIVGTVMYESTKSFFETLQYSSLQKLLILLMIVILLFLFRLFVSYKNKLSFSKRYSIGSFSLSANIQKQDIKSYYLKRQYIRLFIFYFIAMILTYVYVFISTDMIAVLLIGFIVFIFLNRNEVVPYESEITIKEG